MNLTSKRKILVYKEPLDFRCGINAISEIIPKLKDDTLYTFFNASQDRIKIFFKSSIGVGFIYLKLSNGSFVLPEFNNRKNVEIKNINNYLE
jgi:hypothetical protein